MKEVKTILLLFMLTISRYPPMYVNGLNISVSSDIPELPLGKPGGQQTTQLSSVMSCSDPALKYIDCDDYFRIYGYGRPPGTVVIMDSGLTVNQWKYLESNDIVDIIGYWVPDDPNDEYSSPRIISGVGIGDDSLSGIDNSDLMHDPDDLTHGFAMAFALGTIARNVRVLFVNVKFPGNDDRGFAIDKNNNLWGWIKYRVDTLDIRVISMSLGGGRFNTLVESEINQIRHNTGNRRDHEVALVSGLQNSKGADQYYPYRYHEVFGVSSVDHENRGGWDGVFWDSDYYSSTGAFTGDHKSCQKDNYLCTRYGIDTKLTDPGITDYLMPGNGVPGVVMRDLNYNGYDYNYLNLITYGFGSSYSTAYLAGAIMVLGKGYSDGCKCSDVMTVDNIYQTLKSSTNSNSWDRYHGWGTVSVYYAYYYAKNLGTPPSGGGGVGFN